MTESAAQKELRALIRDRLGAIMHNPVRQPYVTCETCATPIPKAGFLLCWECNQQRRSGSPLADRVIALTYSVDGQQSNLDMHRYKSPMSDERRFASDAWQRLSLLVVGFGLWHAGCLVPFSRTPVTGLAVVPSLRGRPGPHPLTGLTGYLPRAWERVELKAETRSDSAEDRRSLRPANFSVPDPAAVENRHIVVFEDTWVRGGHAQSASAALRAAGAAEVTVLAIARRLSPAFAPTREFIESRLYYGREYDIDICPVTGAACPL